MASLYENMLIELRRDMQTALGTAQQIWDKTPNAVFVLQVRNGLELTIKRIEDEIKRVGERV